MTAVEPFKVNASGPGEIATSLGSVAEGFGKLIGGGIDAKREANRRAGNLRDAVAIHQAQMEHEANMQQLAHEQNLQIIDHVTNASMKLDSHQSELREGEQVTQRAHEADMQDRYVSHAQSLLGAVQPGTQAEFSFGGGSFKGVSPLPAPAKSDDSSVSDRRERRKEITGRSLKSVGIPKSVGASSMPNDDAARAARLAAKVSSNVKNRIQFPESIAVENPAPAIAEKAPKKSRAKKADSTTISSLKPGEQYAD